MRENKDRFTDLDDAIEAFESEEAAFIDDEESGYVSLVFARWLFSTFKE